MPEVTIEIGGRHFDVACQEGEEEFLHGAAGFLNEEAQVLASQLGRIPEARMLLMAGLMLADKTFNMQKSVEALEAQNKQMAAELEQMRNAPAPQPQRIEVPVVPSNVTDSLAEIAARVEALADSLESSDR